MQDIPRPESLRLPSLLIGRTPQLNQLRKQETDIPPLVHNRCPTERAPDLGGCVVALSLVGCRVEHQTRGPLIEPNVLFVEDGRPLEGSAVQDLASATVAELGVEGFLSSEGVRDPPAVAVATPLDFAELLECLDLVGRAVLPFFIVESVFGAVVGECWLGQRVLRLEAAHFGHFGGWKIVTIWQCKGNQGKPGIVIMERTVMMSVE